MIKRLFIEPLDVLMFRSERPFTARESHVAKLGVISPLTFEGAIKSKILIELFEKKGYSHSEFQRGRKRNETKEEFERSLEELKNAVIEKLEKDNELKEVLEVIGYSPYKWRSQLNVLGIFFSQKEAKEEWFPVPNDIVRRDDGHGEILKLNPVLKEEFEIAKGNYVCFSKYSGIKKEEGLMSFDSLLKYLWGYDTNGLKIVKYPYERELRTGIQLEKNTKSTVEGNLYAAEFLRLRDWDEKWGFIVWLESPDIEINGLIRLGGEGKGAICTSISEINIDERIRTWELIERINGEKRFKLYLAAPSYLGGYKPPEDLLKKELGVDYLKLKAALPGKPIYIGGYDFALNKEKPLRRWVNSGAVYYYEFGGEIEEISLPIKVLDERIDMRCAFIGRW